jgi:hypothetical protein
VLALVRLVRSSYRPACAVRICFEEKIIIREKELGNNVCALILPLRNSKMIVVNHSLSRVDKCRAIYHELYHYFNHSTSRARNPFHFCERRADVFASFMLFEGERYRRCCQRGDSSVEAKFMRLTLNHVLRIEYPTSRPFFQRAYDPVQRHDGMRNSATAHKDVRGRNWHLTFAR